MDRTRCDHKNMQRFAARLKHFVPYLFLILGGVIMVYPFLFSLLGSLATQAEYEHTVFLPAPATPFAQMRNFGLIFKGTKLYVPILYTVTRILVAIIVPTTVAALGGYVFAKLNFKYKRTAFLILLSSMMIPGVAIMVPNYIWMSKFPLVGGNDILGRGGSGFVNNPAILYVTGWVNVYSIFLFRQCFASLGNEIAESGEMDGASFLTVVFRLYLPLAMPIIAVLSLNAFLGVWNDYMTTLVYFPTNQDVKLIAAAANDMMNSYANPQRIGGADHPKAFAVAMVTMLPPMIVFLFVQKQFVEGLSMGSVKG